MKDKVKKVFYIDGEYTLKNNKKIICLIIIVCIVTGVIACRKIRVHIQKKQQVQLMVEETYYLLSDIENDLGEILPEWPEWIVPNQEIPDYNICEHRLRSISEKFVKLDNILNYYFSSISGKPYTGILNFEFISRVLTEQECQINDVKIPGILADESISEEEVQFLSTLKNDIFTIVCTMESEETHKLNHSFSMYQMESALTNFFDKWEMKSSDSPYRLLNNSYIY